MAKRTIKYFGDAFKDQAPKFQIEVTPGAFVEFRLFCPRGFGSRIYFDLDIIKDLSGLICLMLGGELKSGVREIPRIAAIDFIDWDGIAEAMRKCDAYPFADLCVECEVVIRKAYPMLDELTRITDSKRVLHPGLGFAIAEVGESNDAAEA